MMANFFSKMALIAVFTATNASNLSAIQSKVQSKGVINLDYVPKKELKKAQEKAIKDETFSKSQEFGKIINDLEAIPYSNMDTKTKSKDLESLDSVQKKEFKEAQEAAIKDETFLNGQEFGKIINDWKATRDSNMDTKTESKGLDTLNSAQKKELREAQEAAIKDETFLNGQEIQKKIINDWQATRYPNKDAKIGSKGLGSLHSAPKELVPNHINTLMKKNKFSKDAGIRGETFINRKEIQKKNKYAYKATAGKATRHFIPKVFKPKKIRKIGKLKN